MVAPRRIVFCVAAAVVAGGMIGVPAVAERRTDEAPVALLVPDAAPQPDAEPETVVVTDPPLRPWLEPTEVPVPVDDTPDPDDVLRTQLEQCRLDYGTMTAVALAFVTQTSRVPDDLDEVESTWLHEAPDGWNDDWTFQIEGGGLTVVPTPGGACDL